MSSALSSVGCVADSPTDWGIAEALAPVAGQRVCLTAGECGERLLAAGFTDADIARLDYLISARLSAEDLARLSRLLRDAQDPDDEAELAAIAQEWMQQSVVTEPGRESGREFRRQIYDARFPNAAAAFRYAVCEAGRAFRKAVGIESLRRRWAAAPASNWAMDPADVALGQAIADEGLAEDAKTWPMY